jgi:predicted phage terminase large subunit-like protein
VFAICGLSDERDLYLIDIIREQVDVDATCERFFSLMDEYDISYFYIDDDNSSKMLDRLLVEKCRQRGYIIPMIKMPTRGKGISGGRGEGKEIRAAPLRGLFMQKRVKILRNPQWNPAFIAEAMEFPAVDHDDQIDALSLVGRQFSNIPTPTKERDKQPEIQFFLKERDGVVKTTIGLEAMFEASDDILSMSRRRIQ